MNSKQGYILNLSTPSYVQCMLFLGYDTVYRDFNPEKKQARV